MGDLHVAANVGGRGVAGLGGDGRAKHRVLQQSRNISSGLVWLSHISSFNKRGLSRVDSPTRKPLLSAGNIIPYPKQNFALKLKASMGTPRNSTKCFFYSTLTLKEQKMSFGIKDCCVEAI